jgi:hypothetical protein
MALKTNEENGDGILSLTRKAGDKIVFGNVTIYFDKITGTRCKVRVRCPRDIKITRGEVERLPGGVDVENAVAQDEAAEHAAGQYSMARFREEQRRKFEAEYQGRFPEQSAERRGADQLRMLDQVAAQNAVHPASVMSRRVGDYEVRGNEYVAFAINVKNPKDNHFYHMSNVPSADDTAFTRCVRRCTPRGRDDHLVGIGENESGE